MIPYHHIETVFLDVGNTLISIDFDWVAEELGTRGVRCDAAQLRRSEAAARPGYSMRCFVEGLKESTDLFRLYLSCIVEPLEAAARLPRDELDALITELRRVLRPDEEASTLWRSVMPQVPEALARMQQLGLRLVVVSNSDGTVERSLVRAGLRPFMTAVIDSTHAGFEKPDPRIFTAALAASGSRPDRTLHIGDLYHADVVGARASGLHALLLDPYGDWPPQDCERAPDLWEVANRLAHARAP